VKSIRKKGKHLHLYFSLNIIQKIMSIATLRQIGLLLHIIGVTMAAGVALVSYLASRKFLSQYTLNREKGLAILHTVSILPMIARIGLLILVVSGVMMISASGGGFGQLLWFRIKMILVILIIAVSLFVKMRLDKRLHRQLLHDIAHENTGGQIGTLVRRIGYVQLFLLSFFVIIFVLTSFRFN
jgi:hypothetical protein